MKYKEPLLRCFWDLGPVLHGFMGEEQPVVSDEPFSLHLPGE